MGQTLQNLAKKQLSSKPIFHQRFVIEICEKVHTHYRNIRMVNSLYDWVNMAEGFRDALDRWKKRGCPGTNKNRHIELCRKKVVHEEDSDTIQINLNNNLYNKVDGVFSEGADFTEECYVHLKIRDARIELSVSDFKEVADAVKEANEKLEDSNISSMLQTS